MALATGGSGNAQGVLYARPSAAGGLAARFNLLALLFAQRHYRSFWNDASHRFGEACGVLHVAVNERDRERQAALAADLGDASLCRRLDAETAGKQAGVPLGEIGVEVEVVSVNPGPVVTRFELQPAPGVKSARSFSHVGSSLPQGYRRFSLPRAANSHWTSVGISLPAQAA